MILTSDMDLVGSVQAFETETAEEKGTVRIP